jgi:hypothetical protein
MNVGIAMPAIIDTAINWANAPTPIIIIPTNLLRGDRNIIRVLYSPIRLGDIMPTVRPHMMVWKDFHKVIGSTL